MTETILGACWPVEADTGPLMIDSVQWTNGRRIDCMFDGVRINIDTHQRQVYIHRYNDNVPSSEALLEIMSKYQIVPALLHHSGYEWRFNFADWRVRNRRYSHGSR